MFMIGMAQTMNDLARPALYDAYHEFIAVEPGGSPRRH